MDKSNTQFEDFFQDRKFIDISREIFLNLNDESLFNIFSVNRYTAKFIHDKYFWDLRIQKICDMNLSEFIDTDEPDVEYQKKFIIIQTMNLQLEKASKRGQLSLVEILVELGADIHCFMDKPLRIASEYDHLKVVKYLVEHGADINEGLMTEYEALIEASRRGHLDIVEYLIEQGANIHARNDKAFRLASNLGHLSVVEYLVEQGANTSAKSSSEYNYDYIMSSAGRMSNEMLRPS